jgi:hypothetical protein
MSAVDYGLAKMGPPKRRDLEALQPSLHAKTGGVDDDIHQGSQDSKEHAKFQEDRHKVTEGYRGKTGID